MEMNPHSSPLPFLIRPLHGRSVGVSAKPYSSAPLLCRQLLGSSPQVLPALGLTAPETDGKVVTGLCQTRPQPLSTEEEREKLE